MIRLHFLDHKIPPPLVGIIVAAAMWAVADAGPQFALAPQLKHITAAILIAAGTAFDLLGLIAFHKSRTTINPLRPERTSALVTGGIYRITRNPMYVGMALLLLAWAVYLSAWLPLAGVPAFMWYITQFQIRPEERALEKLFGAEFLNYAARVRRWL
jgi:protein-S-isoprenylcysteine O-methyltransferase Ste14